MLDTDTILKTFINIAQSELAGLLSESGPTAGPKTPSVVKARQSGVTPAFPYAQIDIMNISDTSGYLLHEGVDPDNDENVVYDTHTKLHIQYIVYGGNAQVIADKLKKSFRREFIRNQIETETTGKLEQVFTVELIPKQLSTVAYDVASFDLTFNVNDRVIDSDIGTFDTVDLTGKLQIEDDVEFLAMEIYETRERFLIADVILGTDWAVNGNSLAYSGVGTDSVTIGATLTIGVSYDSIITASSGTFIDHLDRVTGAGVTESKRTFVYAGGPLEIQANSENVIIDSVSIKRTEV